jgi:hypothetical protein
MTTTTDPVCLALYQALAALAAIEASDIATLDDLATVAAIVNHAEATIGLTHRLRIHALADLGATLREQGGGILR